MMLNAAPVALCCTLLSQLFPVTFSNTTIYNSLLAAYWSLQESALHPTCIVSPIRSSDIATTISILTSHHCPFAIKGRTHAPAAGFANIQDGVTVDVTRLDAVEVDHDRGIVRVGAGARWIDVYSVLDPLGLAVAGGRNGNVGVGGLTLGGGISHFTTRVGWACDNVVNFELVLASGLLTNANATFNADLFRALKGGGNNFGVVTRFDLATFAQGDISVTSLVYPISSRNAVFEAFTKITTTSDFDPYVSLVMGLLFNSTSKQWLLTASAVYTKPDRDPEAFQRLKAIPNISNKTVITNLSTFANETETPPLNWLFWTSTYNASADLMSQTFDNLNASLYNFDPPGGVVWSIAFEPFPTLITAFAQEKGGNSLGTLPSDGNGYIVLLSPLWPKTTSNSMVQNIAREVGTKINAVASSQDRLHQFQYLNYADVTQDPLRSYGAANFAALRKTSRKYDPRSVFQTLVPGGFKLAEAV